MAGTMNAAVRATVIARRMPSHARGSVEARRCSNEYDQCAGFMRSIAAREDRFEKIP
jgi:hypothetical protein